MNLKKLNAICLFSSAGIGELGIKANNLNIVASNELIAERHALYKENYPETECFDGDIWKRKNDIVSYYLQNHDEELFLLYATPPCQGMSSNGAGRLMQEVRHGNRSHIDERNRLIIPTIEIIKKLKPRWVIMENVPNMRHTFINDEHDNIVNIMEYIENNLGVEYIGKGEVLACSDYGIPQQRKRLITIYTRDSKGKDYFKKNGNTFFPVGERQKPVTLKDAIGHLPPLDSKAGSECAKDFHELHYVPIMKEEKYWWISNTPEGNTAYNNQCVSETCLYKGNELHRDTNEDGRAQSSKNTPIYCKKCGSLLPRPSMVDKKTGERRLIKGFHSAYRRMEWDRPAHTLTQNFQFEASDNKVHPEQNRVLSTYEALILQTITDYNYTFEIKGKKISRSLFARIIGESVPPKLIDIICRKMLDLSFGVSSTLQSNTENQMTFNI